MLSQSILLSSNIVKELHIGLFIKIARICEEFESFIKSQINEEKENLVHSSLKSLLINYYIIICN